MNTLQKVTKNISIFFLSYILGNFLGFFTLVYSTRYLGVEGFGILSFALAFTGIFNIFIDIGLNKLIIREVARNYSIATVYVANIMLIKLLLSITTICLIFLIMHIIGYDQETMNVIYFITLYTIFISFSSIFYSVFQANEKMEYPSLGNILSNLLLLVGILVAINYNLNITQFSSVYAFVGGFILLYAFFIYSYKFNLPKFEFKWDIWKSLIKEAWPFAITGISTNLYLWVDTIILSFIQGPEAVGLYNASYKLILVLVFIPTVFNNAIFPLMSKYFVSSRESLKITFDKLFKIMILIGFPIGIGTVAIADKIILFVYGDQFLDSVVILQILIWSTVLIFARNPLERLLESYNKQLAVTKIFILGVIFNSIFNIIFIPQFSYVGAAIITVLTDILVLGLLIFAVRKSTGFLISKNTKISLIKIALASFLMGLIVNQLSYLNIFVLITLATLIYILNLLLMKILDNDEISMIKSILSK